MSKKKDEPEEKDTYSPNREEQWSIDIVKVDPELAKRGIR